MTWPMWGHPRIMDGEPTGEFLDVHADRQTAAAYGKYPPVPVNVTVDPEGIYLGWIEIAPRGGREPSDVPELIQHHKLFDMQFTYGAQAEADRGRGRVVRLSIAPVGVDTASTGL